MITPNIWLASATPIDDPEHGRILLRMEGLAYSRDEPITAIFFADGKPNPIGRISNVVVTASGLFGGVEFTDSPLAKELSAKWSELDKSSWAIDVSLIETENVFRRSEVRRLRGTI